MSLEHGVGGGLTQFALYEVGNPKNQVIFESAPARRSFHDKQGQTVPGVGAGMDFMLNTNLAKLNVPGGMPIYQPMGIAEERIEFVGAFIGFDEYMEDSTGKPVFDNAQDKNKSDLNAWQKAQLLFEAARKQRLLALKMSWPHLNIEYENTVNFRGYLKSVVRTLATAQRVYYRVLFVVDPEMVPRKIAPQTAQGSTGATARPGTGGGNGNAAAVSRKEQQAKKMDQIAKDFTALGLQNINDYNPTPVTSKKPFDKKILEQQKAVVIYDPVKKDYRIYFPKSVTPTKSLVPIPTQSVIPIPSTRAPSNASASNIKNQDFDNFNDQTGKNLNPKNFTSFSGNGEFIELPSNIVESAKKNNWVIIPEISFNAEGYPVQTGRYRGYYPNDLAPAVNP